MKVNIRPLTAHDADDTLSYSGEIDLSGIRYWGNHPFERAVHVTGRVKHLHYGRFETDYTVTYQVKVPCGRCLQDVIVEDTEEFHHELREVDKQHIDQQPLSEDMFIPINDGILDVSHMVSTDLLLSIDGVMLCSPDCKGICPICGGDRNEKDCGCSVKMPDPRFDKLRELLDKSSK